MNVALTSGVISQANLPFTLAISVCSRPPAPTTSARVPGIRPDCGTTPVTPAGKLDAVVTHASGWLKLFWKLPLMKYEKLSFLSPIDTLVWSVR